MNSSSENTTEESADNQTEQTSSQFPFDIHEEAIVYPGPEDSISTSFAADGSFYNYSRSVTFAAHFPNDNSSPLPFVLLSIALLITIVSTIVLVVFASIRLRKQRIWRNHRITQRRIPSHINGFSQETSVEMFQHAFTQSSHINPPRKTRQPERDAQQYKSLWAVTPCAENWNQHNSSVERSDHISYKTRSLPSKNKQRPCSSIEDLDEYYSKVNFCKKMRNRMTNDEAAIIAFSRTKSQGSQPGGGGKRCTNGGDAIVIYDERTAL